MSWLSVSPERRDLSSAETIESLRAGIINCNISIDKIEEKRPLIHQEQKELDRKIIKTSSHIDKLNKNLNSCRRAKAQCCQNKNIHIKKLSFYS